MKHPVFYLFIILTSTLAFAVDSSAASLSKLESEQLVADVERVFDGFNRGDPEPFISSAHPLVYQHAGGQAAFESQARDAIRAFRDGTMTLTTLATGAPSELIQVDGGDICFVPRIVRLESNGRQARQTTYVVAIRDVSPQWRYVDAAPFRTNPDLLYTMLPFLPQGTKLPPNTIEVIE